MPNNLRVLFFGDIFGKLGRDSVQRYLQTHKKGDEFDLVVANGENATHGNGLSLAHYRQLVSYGVDVITSGNHFFGNHEVLHNPELFEKEIRPYNFDPSCPLKGTVQLEVNGYKVRITNLIGRVEMHGGVAQSNPFYAIDEITKDDDSDFNLIDFHAEATAEKRCLAEYAARRGVNAVIGTHTHVQTNDAKILGGCFFLTDVGMNGGYDSVIGIETEASLEHTMTGLPHFFKIKETGPILTDAVLIEYSKEEKRIVSYKVINEVSE